MNEDYSIGRVAKAAGCKVQTIRYYEQIGLLAAPMRTAGNQRIYHRADVDRLTFIRHARSLGFPLDSIRNLLSLSDAPEKSCDVADKIANEQLVAVEQRIERLQSLKTELERMIMHCKGGRVADCRVIEVLSDHSLCQSDHTASTATKT